MSRPNWVIRMCDDCLSREDLAAIIQEETADLRDDVDRLESELQEEREQRHQAEQRVDELEEVLQDVTEQRDHLRERVDELETRLNLASSARDSLRDEIDDVDRAVGELQSRALEKSAHLARATDPAYLDVDGDRLERFEGDDGREYVRLPGESDPLSRSGTSRLAQADLLPIQQLARMDDDMLRSAGPLPARLAARAWRERSEGRLWRQGSGKVRDYVDAGDLKVWIRSEEDGVSAEYAKKLASRTIDALIDLTKNQVRIEKRQHRKDGLKYRERRVIVPTGAEIPGETRSTDDSPETSVVHG